MQALLAELRKLPQLRERRRGSFSRGSRAFLYFHADDGNFYVDVQLDGSFHRARVTGGDEQADPLPELQSTRTVIRTEGRDWSARIRLCGRQAGPTVTGISS